MTTVRIALAKLRVPKTPTENLRHRASRRHSASYQLYRQAGLLIGELDLSLATGELALCCRTSAL